MNDHITIPWKSILVVVSLCLLLFLIPPFLQNGLFLGHDTLLHTIYIHKFIDAFLDGQFPVRVIDWIFPGSNVPVFNFYQPGFYYFMLILKLVGFSYSAGLNIGLLFLWIASGVGMFLFVKERFGFLGGLTSGLLFIFAPYHIVDIYVRAAFPEFTALAIFPWIFWCQTRFAKTHRQIYLLLNSFFIAASALSHPETFVMFAPLILVYICFLAYEQKKKNFVWKPFLSFLVGLLLISFFIIPVITEQKFVHMELTYTDKLFDFHNHFVCIPQLFEPTWGYGLSVAGCNDKLSLQLGIVHWVLVFCAIGTSTWALFFSKKKEQQQSAIFAGICVVFLILSLFMTTSFSRPLWDNIPYLRFVEFPWRFLALSIFVSSVLGGYVVHSLNKTAAYIAYGIIMYGIFYWYVPYLQAKVTDTNQFNTKEYLVNDPQFQSSYYSPQQTFFPKVMKKIPQPQAVPTSEVKILKGEGNISQTKTSSIEKNYVFYGKSDATVRFFIHYFPGWNMYLDTKPIPFSYSNEYAFMDAMLPKGQHNITIIFEDTPSRKIGNILSFLTILALPLFYSKKIRSAFGKIITKKSERQFP